MKTVPPLWFEPAPWIDGAWQGDEAGARRRGSFTVRNPATGLALADVVRADADDVARAIEGAATAGRDWRDLPAATRGEILKRTAALLLARRDEMARLLTAEQGKPYSQAAGEVDYAASFFQWFGEEARRVHGRILPHPEGGREFLVEQRAAGVAGLITPWNFPLAQGAKKVAAALAAGCTAVWKPAELTPLVALALAPVLAEAGLPPGVLQIVPGRGSVVGPVLACHPAVRVLSLTGSTATGSGLMAAAAPGIKRVSLELGGNAPFIILPDADLELVTDQLVRLKMFVSGQVCVTANRIFVPADREREFVERLAARIAGLSVGDGLAAGTDAGPLIHAEACGDIRRRVDEAVAAGARIVAENSSFKSVPGLALQNFFPPTVVAGVEDSMRLASEEIFGPVIPLLTYRSLPEAVERANATPYGLAAYVYGADLARCRAVASALEAGIVGVNEWRPLKAEIPFGGVKQSGIGVEGGEEGVKEFLETRVISMPKPGVGA
jgi:succinate-semialdehyde dehydrogenase/glutarate-semialdehyde dehydrogenase